MTKLSRDNVIFAISMNISLTLINVIIYHVASRMYATNSIIAYILYSIVSIVLILQSISMIYVFMYYIDKYL